MMILHCLSGEGVESRLLNSFNERDEEEEEGDGDDGEDSYGDFVHLQEWNQHAAAFQQ